MGRPTILDDLRTKRICDALKDGHSYAAAARAGGIGESTLHEWVARGKAGDSPYAEFAERIARADHEAEERAVQVLRAALSGDDIRLAADTAWKWLARRRPQHWAEPKGATEAPPTEAEILALVEKIRGTGT